MDLRAVAKRMADYNEWRRGSYDVPPPKPRQIDLDIDCAVAALQFAAAASGGEFALGDRVTKRSGSSWTGLVVGFYSTTLTPIGYAVESETERGSVQIYPEKALARAPGETPAGEALNLSKAGD